MIKAIGNSTMIFVVVVIGCTYGLVSCQYRAATHIMDQPSTAISEKQISLSSGTEVAYDEIGHGEKTIIMIHGLGSNKKAWLKLHPYLQNDYQLIALDLPKYLNQEVQGELGMMAYAKLINELVEQLDLVNVHIVGHSMGAQIALHLATLNPRIMNRMILLAPAGIETFSEKERQWFHQVATKEYYISISDDKIKQNFNINFNGGTMPEDALFMYEDRLVIKSDSVRYSRYTDWYVSSIHAMLDEPIYDKLSEIKIPTLVLYGAEDYLIPNRFLHPKLTTKEILEKSRILPNSYQVMIDSAGHFIQWDQPEKVAAAIKNFLDN